MKYIQQKNPFPILHHKLIKITLIWIYYCQRCNYSSIVIEGRYDFMALGNCYEKE